MRTLLPLLAMACAPDPCASDAPASTCLAPVHPPEHYAALSSQYFDTMDTRADRSAFPPYGERVARWEWPPWLLLTGWTREGMEAADTLLRFYPSIVDDRDCRAFDTQPFGRCRVTFVYDAHDGRPCPIYEEFTFNDAGEITWIEAWSDQPDLLPMDADADPWAEGEGVTRLSTRIPGLGRADGLIEPEGPALQAAAETDDDVATFVASTQDWFGTWSETYAASGDDLWGPRLRVVMAQPSQG